MGEITMTVEMVLTALGSVLALIAAYIASLLADLSKSVQMLNTQIAVVITNIENHDKRISKLESLG